MTEPTRYKKLGKGYLYPNDRKEKESHPDEKGPGSVDCPHCQKVIEFRMAAWKDKDDETGKEYKSIEFTQATKPPTPPAPTCATTNVTEADDLPF